MPLVDNTHYVDFGGFVAVGAWAVNTVTAAGTLIRATAATANNERVFICIVAGTTHATTQPTWVLPRGSKTTDGTVTWQECTGLSAVNGDLTNTPSWTISATPPGGVKNTAVVLGQIIKRDNGASYQICTTAGTAGNGSEPAFSDTAGATTVDNTVTWTSLGPVGAFTGNQAPHIKLGNAFVAGWVQAGNTVFVKSTHALSIAGVVGGGAGPGTIANPIRVLCHNGGAYPPLGANLTTGASETSTTNEVQINTLGQYTEGISFTSAAGSVNVRIGANNSRQRYKNCTFTRAAGSGNFLIGLNSSGNAAVVELEYCTFTFANSGNTFSIQGGTFIMRGGSIGGSSLPAAMMTGGGSPNHTYAVFDAVDLSAWGSGKTLVSAMASGSGLYRFINCRLGVSVVPALVPSSPSYRVEFIGCDDGVRSYRSEVYDYAGTLTTETTIILTGGASEAGTPISWKVVTTANARFEQPFECPVISIWNDTVGSPKTLTIQGTGAALPTNADVWVEVGYLGSATPIASFVSDAKATVLTTPAAQDAGSGVWGGGTSNFALAVAFTPAMKGWVYARVKIGKPSDTFYIDPLPVLS